jgi:hypothetical protein
MTDHTSISAGAAANPLAIGDLLEAYAHCADRRGADGQKALLTGNTRFVVDMDGEGTAFIQELHGARR